MERGNVTPIKHGVRNANPEKPRQTAPRMTFSFSTWHHELGAREARLKMQELRQSALNSHLSGFTLSLYFGTSLELIILM